ncbi:MAG: molecular chaperone [Vicinamibacterales bacterium]
MSSTTMEVSDASCRARIYEFLATVFSAAPTDEMVLAVQTMAEYLALERLGPWTSQELQHEYMELFVVPNPRYVAPYESVFCDPTTPSTEDEMANPADGIRAARGLLMGESAESVRRFYEDAGVIAREALPDHIATELGFMAWLWNQQAVRDASGAAVIARLREKFRADHLERWIGALRDEVAERDRLGFYLAALSLTEAVLQSDGA